MARCPHCNEILEDAWLKKMGATLMGKTSGISKARSREITQAAANKRWDQESERLERERKEERARAAKLAKIITRITKPKKKKQFPT